MKKFLAILLMVALLTAIVPGALAAGVASNGKSTVYRTTAKNGLHMRAGAGTSYKILRTLANGTAFTVIKSSGNWYKVKTLRNGYVGWISKTYTARNAYAKVTTKNQGLNVRRGPGTGYAIKGSFPKGTQNVTVKYVSGGWAYVRKGSLEGWSCIKGGYSYSLLTFYH